MGIIYALCDPATDEIRYIGQTCDLQKRIDRHLRNALGGHEYHVYRWIRTLSTSPNVIVLEETDDLDTAEIRWIKYGHEQGWSLTNKSPGGPCPVRKGEPLSPEHRAAISASKMGHAVSEETRRKLGQYWKGRKRIPRTEEHRRHLSESKLNRPDIGQKISEGMKRAVSEGKAIGRPRKVAA